MEQFILIRTHLVKQDITSLITKTLFPTESELNSEPNLLGEDSEFARHIKQLVEENPFVMTGPQLRTYRPACATTGEYTAFHGGTVPLGLAQLLPL